jgi:hypothetical protein
VSIRESGIQKQVADAIKARYREHAWVRVKHGTAYAVVGDPDLYGCVWGQAFGFEIKNEDGELTTIQTYRIKELKKAGAIAGGVQTPMGALSLLDRGLAHLERPGFAP